jgi:hypothetical protein
VPFRIVRLALLENGCVGAVVHLAQHGARQCRQHNETQASRRALGSAASDAGAHPPRFFSLPSPLFPSPPASRRPRAVVKTLLLIVSQPCFETTSNQAVEQRLRLSLAGMTCQRYCASTPQCASTPRLRRSNFARMAWERAEGGCWQIASLNLYYNVLGEGGGRRCILLHTTAPLPEVVPRATPRTCASTGQLGRPACAGMLPVPQLAEADRPFLLHLCTAPAQAHADSVTEAGYKADLQEVASLHRPALGFPLPSLTVAPTLLALDTASQKREERSINQPFIVLTETKFSYRYIPVWARYSPHMSVFG